MLFEISNSFFYTQKVAYFVQKQVILIRSNLRCIAYQTRSEYDQPKLYRRPPRKIFVFNARESSNFKKYLMLFEISNSFFYTQKVAYFVQKQVILIRSNLRCIAYQTRSEYDQPKLYRRPPRCTPAQHTTWRERDHPRPFFNLLKNSSRSPRPLRAGPTNPAVL